MEPFEYLLETRHFGACVAFETFVANGTIGGLVAFEASEHEKVLEPLDHQEPAEP